MYCYHSSLQTLKAKTELPLGEPVKLLTITVTFYLEIIKQKSVFSITISLRSEKVRRKINYCVTELVHRGVPEGARGCKIPGGAKGTLDPRHIHPCLI